jgi:hypothetical protein
MLDAIYELDEESMRFEAAVCEEPGSGLTVCSVRAIGGKQHADATCDKRVFERREQLHAEPASPLARSDDDRVQRCYLAANRSRQREPTGLAAQSSADRDRRSGRAEVEREQLSMSRKCKRFKSRSIARL